MSRSYREVSATDAEIAMSRIDQIDTSYTGITATTTISNSSLKPLTGETTDAGQGSENPNLPLGQVIHRYHKVVGYCLLISIIVVGWGYDLVVIGAINGVEPFQDDYGELFEGKKIIPGTWLSLWLASTPLGMALGSIFAGWYQDVVGRRLSLMTCSAVCAVGVAGIFFSYLLPDIEAKRAMFFTGKVVQGFAVGGLKITALTYMSETTPTALRGPAMGLVPTANLLGQLLGSIVAYLINDVPGNAGYLGAFGSQWILAIVPFTLSIFLPESPSYLMQKGEGEKALQAATRLYAPRVDPAQELEKVRVSIMDERETSGGASYLACFNATHRRRTMIAMVANIVPMLFGLDLISKANYFLQIIGMASSTSLLILMGGIVGGTLANGIGIWVLSRVGRRTAIFWSLGASGVLWVTISVAGFWTGVIVANIVAGCMIGVIVISGVGSWPAAYAVMGEVSSLTMRAKTQGLGGVLQQGTSVMMNFLLPFVFNPDKGDLGAKTGFIYVAMCFAGIAICFYTIPEMKGRSVLEIDEMFNLGLPTRQFKSWRKNEE